MGGFSAEDGGSGKGGEWGLGLKDKEWEGGREMICERELV